jgi:hypothetical protein
LQWSKYWKYVSLNHKIETSSLRLFPKLFQESLRNGSWRFCLDDGGGAVEKEWGATPGCLPKALLPGERFSWSLLSKSLLFGGSVKVLAVNNWTLSICCRAVQKVERHYHISPSPIPEVWQIGGWDHWLAQNWCLKEEISQFRLKVS